MRLIKRVAIVAAMIMAAIGFSIPGNAEAVSQKQAKKLASQFFNALHSQVMGEPKFVSNGRKFVTDRLFNPYYIYNLPKGGYVVIAADNKAFPILAYSPKGSFDPDKIPENLEALLRRYAVDIELIRFDSRIPEEAKQAWENYPDYVDALLKKRQEGTEGAMRHVLASQIIDEIYEDDTTGDDLFSYLYTPDQWKEMVNMELDKIGSVPIGFYNSKGKNGAAVIEGRKGDFYHMLFDDNGTEAYCLLMATEYLSDGQLARLGYTIDVAVPPTEEPPFAFHDSFIAEIQREAEAKAKAIEETLIPSEPVLKVHGSGRYSVEMPQEVRSAKIYNLGGALVKSHKYKGTKTAYIDLTIQPAGFYVADIYDIYGNRYGLKLIR